jgi:adenosylmethionine-8-amino-7-oxononanoate aminotransferase
MAPTTRPALFRRKLDRDFRRAVSGEGCWLTDERGTRYLDASGGAMVANLGHGGEAMRRIGEAMAEATRATGYVNGTQLTNRWAEELAEAIGRHLPAPLRHSYFLASGSEAVEAAVKLARQVQLDRGEAGRWKVISLVPSYHGNTLTALSLSSREAARAPFAPLLVEHPRIAGPDPYRDPDGLAFACDALEEAILREDPHTVCAFLGESIGGSSSGARVPPESYFRKVRKICDRHGVLWIADEVLCGMGRTGKWFAFEHFSDATGLPVPDIMVLGKGLNAGAVPLSAVVATSGILDTLAASRGGFLHAQTYSHTPAICAAGLETVRILEEQALVERVAAREVTFFAALAELRKDCWVGDLRGKGFLAGVELVADQESKKPFERSMHVAERVTEAAFERGLIVWPNSGHIATGDWAGRGDILMIAPPFATADDEMREITRRLAAAIDDVRRADAGVGSR